MEDVASPVTSLVPPPTSVGPDYDHASFARSFERSKLGQQKDHIHGSV